MREARDAMSDAIERLKTAMHRGGHVSARDVFEFKVGFARGKLGRIVQRILKEPDPKEEKRLRHHIDAAQEPPHRGADAYGKKGDEP
jgi:hypothetical protein